jgi:poly(3-hydroxybutyrate) depolymerase
VRAGTLAPGSHTFTYHDAPLNKDLPVHYYLPEGVSPATAPVLFVMHGTLRNGAEYRDQWKGQADRYKFLLIVPEFPKKDFPGAMYNRGNVLDQDDKGPARPEAEWSFSAIERLFDHLRRECGVGAQRYSIYGHSAGGQFVHRLALFLPNARYERAVAANSGYYTLPTVGADADPFPFSLRGTPQEAGKTRPAIFSRDLTVLLGEADTDPNDPDLYHSPEADKQGMYRLARGRFFYETAQAEAKKAGVPLRWRLVTVPGVGHSNEKMADAAAAVLFGKDRKDKEKAQ